MDKNGKQKLADIIVNLIVNTKLGKISWRHSFDARAIKYTTGNYHTISVEMTRNAFEAIASASVLKEGTIFINFYDDNGQQYAKTNDVEMSKFIKNANSELNEMYNTAKSQALHIDENLGAIASTLPELPESEAAALKVN